MIDINDPRLQQAIKIVAAVISKKNLYMTNIHITTDNTLFIICMNTVLYMTKLTDVQPGFEITVEYSDTEVIPVTNPESLYIIRNSIWYYLSMANDNNLVAKDNVLRANDEFESLLSMKAADGNKFYKLRGEKDITKLYYVPVFSGFPININKTDSFGVSIYDLHDGYILIKSTVFKKKINRTIDIFYKTIDLNKSGSIY